jgi:hypothetical protein
MQFFGPVFARVVGEERSTNKVLELKDGTCWDVAVTGGEEQPLQDRHAGVLCSERL